MGCDGKPSRMRGDHREGHSEGQNGACGSSPGLVTASVSWRSGWSGRILLGQGMPEGFMVCKRSGVRIPIAPLFRHSAGQRPAMGRVQDRADCLVSSNVLSSPQVRRTQVTSCGSCGCSSRTRPLLSLFLQVRAGARGDLESRLRPGSQRREPGPPVSTDLERCPAVEIRPSELTAIRGRSCHELCRRQSWR
jgi:hypothetical protein